MANSLSGCVQASARPGGTGRIGRSTLSGIGTSSQSRAARAARIGSGIVACDASRAQYPGSSATESGSSVIGSSSFDSGIAAAPGIGGTIAVGRPSDPGRWGAMAIPGGSSRSSWRNQRGVGSASAAAAAPAGGCSSRPASAARSASASVNRARAAASVSPPMTRIDVGLGQQQPALATADPHRLERAVGGDLGHQFRMTETSDPIDHDKGDVPVGAVSRCSYGSPLVPATTRRSASLPSPTVPIAPSQPSIVAATRVAIATRSRSANGAGDSDALTIRATFSSAEQVPAAARRPVRPERDRDAGGMRRRDVGRPAVEQQVAERRPDHPDAVARRGPGNPRPPARWQWIATSDGASAHEPSGRCERLEMLAGGRAEALGEMEDQPVRLAQPREERLGVARVDVGDPRGGVGEVGLAGRLDVADVAAVIAPGSRCC